MNVYKSKRVTVQDRSMVRIKMTAHMIGDHKTIGGKSPIRILQMYAPKSKKCRKKGLSLLKYILQFDMKDKTDRRWCMK
jgi:hypothetical protein